MKKIIANTLIITGIILTLGTAGASDTSFMPLTQIFWQCVAGIGMLYGGCHLKGVF